MGDVEVELAGVSEAELVKGDEGTVVVLDLRESNVAQRGREEEEE